MRSATLLVALCCVFVLAHGVAVRDSHSEFLELRARDVNTTDAAAGPICSATNPCHNNGTCTATTGVCTCPTGFSGQLCEIDPCTNVQCEVNAKCVSGKCVVDLCARVNCLNGGSCIGGTCQCVNNFTGPFCQEDPCVRTKCINGGFCMPPGVCRCLNKFTGQFCENSPCANVTCLNGGKCLYGECACMPEWSGARCERPSEAARDYKAYSDTIQQLAANVTQIGQRMQMIHNVSAPGFISAQLRDLVRDIQENFMVKVRNDSKADFATPKVLGNAPVRRENMRMPNTPMENAKIYEDKDLAYQKAREVRDKRLLHAMDTIQKYDAQRVTDAVVIAKDVPGAEYFKGPFGGFTQVTEKYIGVDNSLLEQDLSDYHRERNDWESFMEN